MKTKKVEALLHMQQTQLDYLRKVIRHSFPDDRSDRRVSRLDAAEKLAHAVHDKIREGLS